MEQSESPGNKWKKYNQRNNGKVFLAASESIQYNVEDRDRINLYIIHSQLETMKGH